LRAALELFDAGVAMMRQNLRRTDPHPDEDTIRARLQAWLATRPGAEHGDAEGTPADLASFRR